MLAIGMKSFGEAEVLELVEKPDPILKKGHVRVRVLATALNRADLLQRRGFYPPPQGESDILGLEMAGEVIELGEGVNEWSLGDRVCALLPGGGYAEQVVVPAGMLAKVPNHLSAVEAAAIPEVFLTAYSNLVWLGGIKSHDEVLIHAGASGVGTSAIQLVKALGGRSYVTVGSKEKLDFCLQLGAKDGVNYKESSFLEYVAKWTSGNGVNIIMDFIGAPYLEDNLKSLAIEGRLIVIGTMGGADAIHLPMGLLLGRRLQILGTALRSRSLTQKMALTKEFWQFATPLFEKGELKPVIDKVFPIHEVAAAHRYMESNQNIGKIVLNVAQSINE